MPFAGKRRKCRAAHPEPLLEGSRCRGLPAVLRFVQWRSEGGIPTAGEMNGMKDDRTLVTTLTGEPFQPARIHYDLFDEKALTASFSRLRCFKFDAPRDRWVWLYADESQGLEFKVPRSAIPPNKQPVVLGSVFVRGPRMIVEVRSLDRVAHAIALLDRHVARTVAKATHVLLAERLFDTSEGAHLAFTFEKFFDADDPKAERFPLNNYYEDGICPVKLALTMRQIVAMEQWRGNTAFTISDAIRQIVHRTEQAP